MQKIMDEYAGGIKTDYKYTGHGLDIADERIRILTESIDNTQIDDMHDLLELYELRDRLVVSRVLIAHLKAREETRWHCFQENADHPNKSDEFECYINSVMKDGKITITKRNLVKV
jgi:adenylylsulfate reductase subunit A